MSFGDDPRDDVRPESYRPHHNVDSLRVPPQSVEAEQAVIGGLMLDPERFADAQEWLTEADFYRRDHRLIYRGIAELSEKNKPFDAVTLGEWFEANGLSEQIGGSSYLIELASTTPSAANMRAYCEIVRGASVRRGFIEAGTELVNDGFQPDGMENDELLERAQARLLALGADRGKGGLVPPKPVLKAWFQKLQDRWNAEEWMTGLSTPFTGMDEITFGLQGGDLVILAARPGMGKTVAGGMIAKHCAEHHGPAALFSLEMSHEQMMQRLVACYGRVPHQWLRSPKAWERKHEHEDSEPFWANVNAAIRQLTKLPLFVDDTGANGIDQVISRARRQHKKTPLKLIEIDHIHIVPLKGKDPVNELGIVSGKLKALAKETGACVVALAQLNRGNKDRTDKRPTMTDLRASGAIEQDADEIWFLHREDYYDKKTHLRKVVELINGKSRNAPVGETAYLYNRFDQMRLEDWQGPLPEKAQPDDAPRARGFRKPRGGQEAAAGSDA